MINPQDIDIQTLLPQRPPIVMVDRLLSADDRRAETELLVRVDNIFVEDGALKTYALIENMAQTCAAQLGYADVYVNGHNDVRIGYIGSFKKMRIDAAPKVGETVVTRIEVMEEIGDLKLVTASSFVNGRCVATAELTIALSGERRES